MILENPIVTLIVMTHLNIMSPYFSQVLLFLWYSFFFEEFAATLRITLVRRLVSVIAKLKGPGFKILKRKIKTLNDRNIDQFDSL